MLYDGEIHGICCDVYSLEGVRPVTESFVTVPQGINAV